MSIHSIARNRFGLGVRYPEPLRLEDPRGWLLAQLEGEPPELGDDLPPESEVGARVAELLQALRRQEREELRSAGRAVRTIAERETTAVLATRVLSDRPFVERWIAFWSNHLCVSSAGKPHLSGLVGAYERRAIRPHVLGRYEDLLLASARHPAMLLYLDNAQSVGPASRAARLGQRGGPGGRRRGPRAGSAADGPRRPPRGLNENYARELLELHTVGVEGGYTQQDVEQLARVLTGWTVSGIGPGRGRGRGERSGGEAPGFRFLDALHEPGAKTVLGVRYAEAGQEEGSDVLRDLARRPETARFIATKLARHFVADEPPATVVDALTRSWLASGGDLREVARALVNAGDAWREEHGKFRSPQDWLVAVLRILGARRVGAPQAAVLAGLNHPLWAPPSPAGYGDLVADWADADSLMNRAELARSIVERLPAAGRIVEDGGFRGLLDLPDGDPLGPMLADASIAARERLALTIAGPAFQWR